MQSQTYQQPVNPEVLGSELVAAIPALRGELGGLPVIYYTLVSPAPDTWTIDFPDTVDAAQVAAVFAAHQGHLQKPRTLEEREAAHQALLDQPPTVGD